MWARAYVCVYHDLARGTQARVTFAALIRGQISVSTRERKIIGEEGSFCEIPFVASNGYYFVKSIGII